MRVTDTVRDAAYVTVGFGVIGFQRAQVRRHELTKALEGQVRTVEDQVAGGRKAMAELAGHVDTYVKPVRVQLETQLDGVESALPPRARDLVRQVRSAAQHTEETVRTRLGITAA